jgi:hypothetical protein
MPTKKNLHRRNPGRTLQEILGEDISHGQPECTRCTQEISKHQKQRTWDDTETNKGTLRGPQQTPKWNKGHYKKRDTWIEEDNKNYKRSEQRFGKPQKNQTEILEIKIPYRHTKNTVEGHSSRLEQVEDRTSAQR